MSFSLAALKEITEIITSTRDVVKDDLANYKNLVKEYQTATNGGQSLVTLANELLVQPIFIVSSSLRGLKEVDSINKLMLDLFTGYYIQAINIIINVKDIRVIDAIRILNRADESYMFHLGLESIDEDYEYSFLPINISTETITQDDLDQINKKLDEMKEATANLRNANREAKKATALPEAHDITKEANLQLGRTITIKSGKENGMVIQFPVNIKAGIYYLTNKELTEIISSKGPKTGFRYRLDELKSGGISFFKEFVFANDLIDEYKNMRVRNSSASEVIEDVSQRTNKGIIEYIRTGQSSISALYGGVTIDKNESLAIERQLGGPLSSPNVREKFFNSTMSMFLAVVDSGYEEVTIYTKDIRKSTTTSFKELSRSKDVNGPAIGEFFKAFQSGMSPQL